MYNNIRRHGDIIIGYVWQHRYELCMILRECGKMESMGGNKTGHTKQRDSNMTEYTKANPALQLFDQGTFL